MEINNDPKLEAKKHVQNLVLDIMKRNDWSQSDLARRASMPRNNISLYARGKTLPSYDHALKLARVLRVDPAELTGLSSAETQPDENVVNVTSLPNGKFMLSLKREVSAAELTDVLRVFEQLNLVGSEGAGEVN